MSFGVLLVTILVCFVRPLIRRHLRLFSAKGEEGECDSQNETEDNDTEKAKSELELADYM